MRSFSIFIALVAVLVATSIAGAGQVDRSPVINYDEAVPDYWADLLAPWDLLFFFETATITGAAGNTGAEWDGRYYYSARWASNLIHQYDKDANLLKEFSIPGVVGLRDLAYNPNNGLMYGGAAGGTIWGMDFINETLEETIVGNFLCRAIAYDHKEDYFYVSNWGDPVYVVDHAGNVLFTFDLVTTTSTYGFAYDNSCFQKPMLYIFDQTDGGAVIWEWNLLDGTFTGVTYDVTVNFPSTIAGALFITDEHPWWPDTWIIGGLAQDGFGTDPFFVYELCEKDSVSQWDMCFRDVLYAEEMHISLAGGPVFHGQVGLNLGPNFPPGFPAAITGYIDNGKVYIAIDYWNDLGLRFYEINIAGLNGTSWGVDTKTGKFYEVRRNANLVGCAPPGETTATESGALVK